MNQQEKCSQCLQQFSLINPPRLMPLCQHNICTRCLKQAIQHRQQFIDCGFCTKKVKRKDIKLFPKNIKLIQKIKSNHFLTSNLKEEKSTSHSSTNVKNSSLPKEEQELLIATEISDFPETQIQTTCETHKKPLDIICATQKKRICPHCAIFGNHKDHKFKTLVEFETEVKEKTERFIQITKKKEESQSTKNIVNLKKTFNQKIDLRKSLLSSQIQKTFEELITKVKQTQKSIEAELEQKLNSVRAKINENLSNELKLKSQYISWQSSCNEVVNRLKLTDNPKNRIQIYYDSPLEICEQGNLFLDEMIKNLSNLYQQADDQVNSVSIKTEERSFDNFITLVCPILEETTLNHELEKIQKSFEKDFFFKNQPATRQDLEQNSFIFEAQVSAIHLKEPVVLQKKQVRNKLNKSFTSVNTIANLTGLFTPASKNHYSKNEEKLKQKQLANRTRTSFQGQRRFGSPDFSKPVKTQQFRTPEEILISLASNDFINEIDLSEMGLRNHDIAEFLSKAQKIRPVKAIKLQKNDLTDDGFENICKYLQHVSNLNLSFNYLTDRCLDILIRNKEYFYKMRIINLSHNRITADKTDNKIKGKLEEIKKLGIVVTL